MILILPNTLSFTASSTTFRLLSLLCPRVQSYNLVRLDMHFHSRRHKSWSLRPENLLYAFQDPLQTVHSVGLILFLRDGLSSLVSSSPWTQWRSEASSGGVAWGNTCYWPCVSQWCTRVCPIWTYFLFFFTGGPKLLFRKNKQGSVEFFKNISWFIPPCGQLFFNVFGFV